MKLESIIIKNSSGVSITKRGLDYIPVYFKTGYFVALTDNKLSSTDYKKAVIEIDTIARKLHIKKYFYGYWKDEKTKDEYFDLSLHLKSKTEAINIGKLFNQKAIFDCKKIDSVYL